MTTVYDILLELVGVHYTEGGWDTDNVPYGVKEAKAAITRLIAEVVGKDEEVMHLMNQTLGVAEVRNQLRAEQRKRLAILTNTEDKT